ncbi:MAG: hypothetical protein AAB582_01460 [Patescibacteria group bacterium]
MPENPLPSVGPEHTPITNPTESSRHTVRYVVTGLLVVLLLLGIGFGFQYLKPLASNNSVIGTEKFDFSEEELRVAEAEATNKLQADFGFIKTVSSDLYIDSKSNSVQDEGETLHNMRVDVHPFPGVLDVSGNFIAQESLSNIYWSQSKKVDTAGYGTVLVGTEDIPSLPLVSWVSYEGEIPLVFSAAFNSEGVKIDDTQHDFDLKAPLLLKSVLKAYPSDSNLTGRLIASIDSAREKNRGGATTKVLRSETSSSGYTFTLTEFDKSQVSNSCDMFVSGWSVESAKELVSCEVKITLNTNERTYLDEQLKRLGGLPDKWISGNEIITSRTEGGDGMGETGYGFLGIFNADTEIYTQILKVEHPGFYWRRALIEYEFGNTKERLLFVESSDAYLLYEIKTSRSLAELFSSPNDADSMVNYLNPLYKSELTLVGTMPLAVEITDNSKYTFDISLDSQKNILFELGGYTDFPKNYVYTIGGSTEKIN